MARGMLSPGGLPTGALSWLAGNLGPPERRALREIVERLNEMDQKAYQAGRPARWPRYRRPHCRSQFVAIQPGGAALLCWLARQAGELVKRLTAMNLLPLAQKCRL